MTGRRRLLRVLWGALALVATGEIAWVVASFLRPRARAGGDAADVVVAGPVGRFPPGSVTAFPGGRFYLVRLEEGGFLALHRKCTHLGCTVPWNEERREFVCPCHSSVFDVRGVVVRPPAPRPLDRFAVRIENGIVKVDVSRPLPRKSFEPSQVVGG